jgi:hypothetical protein
MAFIQYFLTDFHRFKPQIHTDFSVKICTNLENLSPEKIANST